MSSTATLSPPAPATPPPAPADQRWTPRLWGTLLVLCAVLFLDGLDISMVGVTLPAIQTDLGLSTATLQWIVSGYVLGYGGLLLLGGRTADLLGRRRVLLIALAVFAGASVLGGLVEDGTLLIATRFIKGLAAAFTAPAGLSILTTTFPEGPVRNRALGIYTVFGASGFSSGLILGGLLTEIDWRVTFLLPAPLALIALVAGLRLLPRDGVRNPGGYDVLGAATSTGALLLLVFTVVNAPEAGWTSLRTLGSLAVVAALAAAFVIAERTVAHPLVRLGIFANRSLVRADLTAMAVSGGYLSFQFIVALYLQNVLGWSPLQMALSLLPAGIIVASSGPVVGRLITRYGTRRLIALGMVAFVAAYALFLRAGPEPAFLTVILPTALLLGLGFALSFSALNVQATNGVADDEQGLASGLVQSSFQVGGAVALAVTSAVVGGGAIVPGRLPDTFLAAIGVVTAISLLGLLAAVLGRSDRTSAPDAVENRSLAPQSAA
ncbi:MFS transporter [Catellatospora citrea]|uniref:MFS transporter n=1 Tax=Catellatospora citrea TaxID=53366 RepID=A0A8J3NWK4_9ACTN|nr:MFS transporter [Catellatospora citrea]RKE07212.1 EmrB/QacA subfamily drug resistance transporter [Catellatospora citrea]GIF95365.1 MFS transporter [Catellatospora citrea]